MLGVRGDAKYFHPLLGTDDRLSDLGKMSSDIGLNNTNNENTDSNNVNSAVNKAQLLRAESAARRAKILMRSNARMAAVMTGSNLDLNNEEAIKAKIAANAITTNMLNQNSTSMNNLISQNSGENNSSIPKDSTYHADTLIF